MKILAFDQASQKTGAAWFEDTTLLGYSLLDYHKIKDAEKRSKAMIEGMYALIKEHNPDVIVFEDVALQRNVGTVIMLAQLQGSLLGYCYNNNVTGMIYKPSVWRKILGFHQGRNVKREDLKAQAQQFVHTHYDTQPTEDEADAICIGTAFLVEYQGYLQAQEKQAANP